MDKFEYNAKLEEINRLAEQEEYEEAAKLADTIEWKRVRNVRTLCMISEIYEANEQLEESKQILLRAYRRSPIGRNILYRLTETAVKLQEFDEAVEYYTEYVNAAPNDNNKYILKYKIYKGRGSSLEEQIAILQEYKKKEYTERWAFELVKLYEKANMTKECVEECDDITLWFHNGGYVVKALEVKRKYAPLTPEQQTIYDNPSGIVDLKTKEETVTRAVPKLEKKILKGMPKTQEEALAANIIDEAEREIAASVFLHTQEKKREIHSNIKSDVDVEKTIKMLSEHPVPEEEPEVPVYPSYDTADLQEELAKNMREILSGIRKVKVEEEDPIVSMMSYKDKSSSVAKNDTGDVIEDEKQEQKEAKVGETDTNVEVKTELKENDTEFPHEEEIAADDFDEDAENLDAADLDKDVEIIEAADLEEDGDVIEAADLENDGDVIDAEDLEEDGDVIEAADLENDGDVIEAADLDDDDEIIDAADFEEDGDITEAEDLDEEEEEIEAEDLDEEEEEIEAEDLDEEEEEIEAEDLDEEEEEIEADDFDEDGEEAKTDVNPEKVTQGGQNEKNQQAFISGETIDLSAAIEAAANTSQLRADSMKKEQNLTKKIPKSVSAPLYHPAPELNTAVRKELTTLQKETLGYFSNIKGFDCQLAEAIGKIMQLTTKDQTSKKGNVIVTGACGSGRTTLSINLAKVVSQEKGEYSARVAKIYAEDFNKKDIPATIGKIAGGTLIIEEAGDLDENAVMTLSKAMEFKTNSLLVILEDEKRYVKDLLGRYPAFAEKFDVNISVPVFTNDELVDFGKEYADELDYRIDELAVPVLYDRIGALQSPERPVVLGDVKAIVDKAIHHVERFGARKLFSSLSGKRFDEEDRIVLYDKDFK